MILEDDPITAEIRTQKISAQVGDNLQKLLEHDQKLEKEAIKSGKYHESQFQFKQTTSVA
jgi:hypothetical protein